MSITILNAVYASNNMGLDVTSLCQQRIASGQTVLVANNETFSDPDPGHAKRFMIRYLCAGQNGDQPIDRACVENTRIDLVQAAASPAIAGPQRELAPVPGAQFRILHAVYGTPLVGMDVTAYCQAQANQGVASLSLQVSNIPFGIDPAPGIQKTLVIQYVSGGQTLHVGAVDFETLTLTALPPVPAPVVDDYRPGKPFQLGWRGDDMTVIVQVPLVGSHVLATKQLQGANNGRNTWMQKHANGRIYLLDTNGNPTRYCLEASLGSVGAGDGLFVNANNCHILLNEDIAQRQTQLWSILEQPGGATYLLQNIGISASITDGPAQGPYVIDSSGSASPGSACKLWQQQAGNRNQSWLLLEPMPA